MNKEGVFRENTQASRRSASYDPVRLGSLCYSVPSSRYCSMRLRKVARVMPRMLEVLT